MARIIACSHTVVAYSDTGTVLWTSERHSAHINFVRLCPAPPPCAYAGTAATCSRDGTAKIVRLADGAVLQTFTFGTSAGWKIDWSADGRFLVIGYDDGLLVQPLGDSPTAPAGAAKFITTAATNAVALSPDSRLVAAAMDGGIAVWELGETPRRVAHSEQESGFSTAWHARLPRILVGGGSGALTIWEVVGGTELRLLVKAQTHRDWIKTAYFNEQCTLVLSSSFDRDVALSNAEDLSVVWKVVAHTSQCRAAVWLNSEDWVVSCGDDSTLRILEARSGKEHLKIETPAGPVTALAVVAYAPWERIGALREVCLGRLRRAEGGALAGLPQHLQEEIKSGQ